MFHPPEWHDTLPSTNTYLRERLRAHPDLDPGTVVATLRQTQGRGRHNRQWVSSPGLDLAFSFLLRPDVSPERSPSLAMAVSLAVQRTLCALGLDARVKWPNDVVVHRRKIAGILSEYIPFAGKGPPGMVVGVGVNVNMTLQEAAQIDRPATSMLIELGKPTELSKVLEAVLRELPSWLLRWQTGGFQALRGAWTASTEGIGSAARVTDGAQDIEGIVEGFGDEGELLLVSADGTRHVILLGDLLA